MQTVDVHARDQWRLWLEEHHDKETGVWLVFPKKHTGLPAIPYAAAVEEALCFGWIDSIIKRLDGDRYARKFTPRNSGSEWSDLNKQRIEKMTTTGRMTEAGMAVVEAAKASGDWTRKRTRPDATAEDVPAELGELLDAHPDAAEKFFAMAPSHRKRYNLWIGSAKLTETRRRRAAEAVGLLFRGEQLGLK